MLKNILTRKSPEAAEAQEWALTNVADVRNVKHPKRRTRVAADRSVIRANRLGL